MQGYCKGMWPSAVCRGGGGGFPLHVIWHHVLKTLDFMWYCFGRLIVAKTGNHCFILWGISRGQLLARTPSTGTKRSHHCWLVAASIPVFQLTITWRMSDQPISPHASRKIITQYKIQDKNVAFFAPGTSKAVLWGAEMCLSDYTG